MRRPAFGGAERCLLPGDAGERERQRDRGREEAQQHALREQMHDEPRAACAKRDAHGELLAAADRARQQKIRRVRARDEQHERDGAEHDAEHAARRAADGDVLQRLEADAVAAEAIGFFVRGVGEPGVDAGADRSLGDIRTATHDDDIAVVARALRFGEARGQPDDFLVRIRESFRHHADDGCRRRVDADLASDDRRIAAVALLPDPPGKNDDRGTAGSLVVGVEIAAERRRDAERAPEIRADAGAVEALRLVHVAEVDGFLAEAADFGLAVELATQREQIAAGQIVEIVAAVRTTEPGVQQLVGRRKRQRADHEAVEHDQHEHHAGQANAEHTDDERRERAARNDRAERGAKLFDRDRPEPGDCTAWHFVHRRGSPSAARLRGPRESHGWQTPARSAWRSPSAHRFMTGLVRRADASGADPPRGAGDASFPRRRRGRRT